MSLRFMHLFFLFLLVQCSYVFFYNIQTFDDDLPNQGKQFWNYSSASEKANDSEEI